MEDLYSSPNNIEKSIKRNKCWNKFMASRDKLRTKGCKDDCKDKLEKDKPIKRPSRNMEGPNYEQVVQDGTRVTS